MENKLEKNVFKKNNENNVLTIEKRKSVFRMQNKKKKKKGW